MRVLLILAVNVVETLALFRNFESTPRLLSGLVSFFLQPHNIDISMKWLWPLDISVSTAYICIGNRMLLVYLP